MTVARTLLAQSSISEGMKKKIQCAQSVKCLEKKEYVENAISEFPWASISKRG